jgi:succinoglycan biosynthesis transport protein ExoP
MQLRYYARVVRYWLWLIVFGTTGCALLTYTISQQIPPVYQASTLIQVDGAGTTDSSSVFANQALAVSYALLITSNDVLLQVAHQLPGVSLQTLQASVSASPEENTQIIQIRANASTSQQAATIADKVAQVFITIEVKKTTAPLQNLADQLAHLLTIQKMQIDSDQAQLAVQQSSGAAADVIARQRDKVNDDQANYNATLTNYQQVQLQLLKATDVVSLVQMATPPDAPTSPHILLDTVIAAMLGLLLSLTFALLLDWLDVTIKTPEDIMHRTSLTPLGSIGRSPHPPLTRGAMIAVSADETMERDFIAISTSLCKVSQEKGLRAILVTGLRQGCGSTTTAVYLALALAQMGKRVLLVDANFRRSFLHEIFPRQNIKGLTNSIFEVYQFRQEIVLPWLNQWLTHIPNLWFLPAGPPPLHPPALLRSQELSLLQTWLLGQQTAPAAVDFILFDTPALKDHADTLALASVVSATLLVIEAGKEGDETLLAAEDMLQRIGTSILGVIINRQTAHHYLSIYTRHAFMRPRTPSPLEQAYAAISSSTPSKQTMTADTPPVEMQSIGSGLFSKERDRHDAVSAFSLIQPPQSFRGAATPPRTSSVKSRQFIQK